MKGNNTYRLFTLVALLLLFTTYKAQIISPAVFNSGGETYTTSISSQPVIYTDNIGEVFIDAPSNSFSLLTQGFLQPAQAKNQTTVNVLKGDVSCRDKADGHIIAEVLNAPGSSTITYIWNPASICTSLQCNRVDNLSAGNYSLTVLVEYTISATQTKTLDFSFDVTINDSNEPCRLKIYNGVTINGNNPFFYLENIEEFPNNSVTIFNRWGVQLFNTKGYNNRDNYWPVRNSTEKITSGTYFYVIDLGDGSKVYKGWLEVWNY